MRYDEFLATVRERGEYADQKETAEITATVLGLLSRRISPGEVADLAAQLPQQLRACLDASPDRPTENFGPEVFLDRIAEQVGAHRRTAEWDVSAVLSTLADAVSGGELNQIISQLPSGYATFFGKADLAG